MNKDYHIKVDGHSNLVRDNRSNAIINTDKKAYDTYKSLKTSKILDKKRIDQIESDLFSLKNDIGEIKDLLKEVLKNQ
jgi:hypothetical protein